MSSPLRDRLYNEAASVDPDREPLRAATLRLAQEAVKELDRAARSEDRCNGADDAEIQGVLDKMIAQRTASAASYEDAGRLDLAEQERHEAEVLKAMLPPQLSDVEIRTVAENIAEEMEAQCLKDVGRCLGALKARYTGRMDFGKASSALREILR